MKKFLPILKKTAFAFFFVIITTTVANAATYFSIANGNWNVNTTWSLTSGGAAVGAGVFPIAGDIVTIEGGDNVTIPAGFSAFCTTLNVANSTVFATGTLTFAATASLAVSGNITVGFAGSTSREGTINMAAGGTLTCAGNVTIGNDGTSAAIASEITQGAGSIVNVTGNVSIITPGNNFTNRWAVNDGTASITGTLTMANTGGANQDCAFSVSTGTATITGAVTMNGAANENLLSVTGAGTLNLGNSISAANGTFTLGAGSTVNYTGTAQTLRATTTYQNLIVSGSGAKTTTGVTIAAAGRLSMQGTATITAAPTYTAGATLEYAGSGAQTSTNTEFAAAGGPTNLIINNTNDVTLHAARTITALTLTNGNLIIPTASTRLTITSTAAIGGSGFDANKCIVTQVNTGTGATAFVRVSLPAAGARTIPVGDGTNYLPVTLTPANANSFDVCAFNGITANGTPNGTAFSPSQKSFVVDAVWVVNLTAGATGAGVTMTTNWPETLEGAVFSTNPDARIGISRYGGAAWDIVTGTGNQGGNTATRTLITAFSPFGVGGINKPLPIAIQYFNAAKGNGYNTLNWKAACSSDKAVFEIERSTDGRNFATINTVTATQAECAQSVNYVDNTILTGAVFYRIKTVDVDGKATYSVIIKLGGTQSDIKLAGILPNPVMNTAQLNIVTAKKDYVNLSIVSMEGKLVHRSTVQLQAGSSIISLDVTNLQKGLYIIKGVFADGEASSIKFVKQ